MSREVPEGWRSVTLSEIASITLGQSPKTEATNDQGIGLPFFQGNADFGNLHPKPRRWTESGPKVANQGDILISVRAPVGELNTASQLCYIGRGLGAIRATNVEVQFLFYALRFSIPQLHSVSQGSTFDAVNRGDLSQLTIMLPSLHEQRRIAEILSSVDDAIAATLAVIEQTKTVKQATLERLLTKGIGHTRFKQTEIGEIPDSWIISIADEICSQISVGIVIKPSRYYTDNGIRCFRSANVREGFIEDADWVFITEEGNRVNRKSILKTGDVLVVRTGYPGTSCVVTPEYDGANCIDIIFARPDLNRVEPRFLSAFINSESGKLQVLKAEGGLAQKHFNVGSMKVMKIPLPTIAEQREIVRHIEDFTQAENSLKKLLEQYKSMKSALMSDLLTGRKRVTDTLPLAAE